VRGERVRRRKGRCFGNLPHCLVAVVVLVVMVVVMVVVMIAIVIMVVIMLVAHVTLPIPGVWAEAAHR
jgi:hypothetical protein